MIKIKLKFLLVPRYYVFKTLEIPGFLKQPASIMSPVENMIYGIIVYDSSCSWHKNASFPVFISSLYKDAKRGYFVAKYFKIVYLIELCVPK